MPDFADLRARTSVEREAAELQRFDEEIGLDRSRWRESSEKSVHADDDELRYTLTGGGVIHLRCRDERARTLAAVWYMLYDFTWDRFRAIFYRLWEATALRLDACAPETRGTKIFEFVAQYLAGHGETPIP